MKGLGLYTGPLAVVVWVDPETPEDRPAGYARMGEALGIYTSDTPDRLGESIAGMWADRFTEDIVMVVEVLL